MRHCSWVIVAVAFVAVAGCNRRGGGTPPPPPVDAGSSDGGSCTPACAVGQSCCPAPGGVVCVDTTFDTSNCGSCGVTCTGGEACVSGICSGGGLPDSGPAGCVPVCSASQRCCGTACVSFSVAPGSDGRTDPTFANCNGCGLACDANRASACASLTGGAPACTCGATLACAADEECRLDGTTFSCVPSACTCAPGLDCCGTDCVDRSTDPANCGTCGFTCPTGQSCVAGSCMSTGGTCTPACVPPGIGAVGEICCAGSCVPNGVSNCGACGNTCAGGEVCTLDFATMMVCCGTEVLPGVGMCTP